MAGPPGFFNTPFYTEPTLSIVRQPQKRGYRFRYHSEGLTHGGIRGEPQKDEKEVRIHPTLKLSGYRGKAKVVLTIVTANPDEPPHLHAHSLIVNKEKTKGYHVFNLEGNNPVLHLTTVAIQHVVKEKLIETLMDRILQSNFLQKFGWSNSLINFDAKQFADLTAFTDALKDKEDVESFTHRETNKEITGQELDALKKQADHLSKSMTMNRCRLSFQAFLKDDDGHFSRKLDPVYSDTIYDGKTKHGAALKITRISKVTSSVSGDEEVWVIADKLHADDLEVRFFEEPKHGEFPRCWEGFGKFQKTDVLKQICLIFRTPEYHDKSIEQPVNVHMQLRRKTDPDCISEPQPFKYIPIVDRYGIGEKRKKEIPMEEILCFTKRIKKLPVESSCFATISKSDKNPPVCNFQNNDYFTSIFGGNQLNANMCINPAAVTPSTSNFGVPSVVNTITQNSGNSTVVNTSDLNFDNFPTFNMSNFGFPPAVSTSCVVSNHSITSTTTGNSQDPEIKVEEEPMVPREAGEQVMDYCETDDKNLSNDDTKRTVVDNVSSDLARFANLEGQSESMINFLAFLSEPTE